MKRDSLARASCYVEPQLYYGVLVITHEAANEEDIDTYLQEHFYPCRPLMCFGRSANMDPLCPPKEALWWRWKDSAVILVMPRALMF